MEPKTYKTKSVQETYSLAESFAKTLKKGDVIAFFGSLGMGKTAFIRGLAKGLDISENVSSPTYALVHEYSGEIPLYHFDMYRVSGWDDLYSTGFFDYLEMGGIVAVEWSENIENALPEESYRIEIRKGEDEDERIITIGGGRENDNTCA